jgi:tRNA-2-methylthio-N6-dimethylallyladenosine synthase
MKRGYTVEEYWATVDRIREMLPHASLASDFIVGFCGETDEDYRKTVDLVERCRFKNSFIFKYSERAGTKAAERLPDDVPDAVKQQRNNDLLAVQNAISDELNQQWVGRTVEVLVEGKSKLAEKNSESGPTVQLVGRTPCDRIVAFDGTERHIGQVLPVTIYDNTPHTLLGMLVEEDAGVPLVTIGGA